MTARQVGTAYARSVNKWCNAFSRLIVNLDANAATPLCQRDVDLTWAALEESRAAFRALTPQEQQEARSAMGSYHATRAIVNAQSEGDL